MISSYLEVLRSRNQTDFSGLLSETVRLMREYPEVRERLQKKFRFIQVDEWRRVDMERCISRESVVSRQTRSLGGVASETFGS